MKPFIRLLSALLFATVFAPLAQADLKTNLGPLADVVQIEDDGEWKTSLQDGWFNLINTKNPSGVRAYKTSQPPLNGGERETSLNVYLQAQDSDPAMAGIMLNYLGDDNFMGIVIDAQGNVGAITLMDGEFSKQDSDTVRARLDGSDVLKVRETVDQVLFYLNGEEVFNLDQNGGSNDFNQTYGIIAIGKGRFAFNGFNVTQTGGSAFPAPGGTGFPAPGGGDTTPAPKPFPAPGGGTTGQAPTPAPAPAPQMDETQVYQGKVVLGTTLGIFFHELGHALIGETQLPATGPEEDVADEFSAIIMGMIAQGGDQNTPLGHAISDSAEYASLFWFYAGVQSMDSDLAQSWQDEHAPGLKRFRNSFCMLYASNPKEYEDLAQKVDFEDTTKQRCMDDYSKRLNAWNAILSTVMRPQGSTGGGTLSVRFEQPSTDTGRMVKALLGDTGDMARVVGFLGQMFNWPRDLQVVFRDCEDVNAWYSPDDASITMCYQMTEFASQIIFEGDKTLADAPAPAPAGTPAPDAGNRPLTDAEKFLVGIWTASMPVNGGTAQFAIAYADDLSYLSQEQYPNVTIKSAGVWAADVITDGGNVIALKNSALEWEPKQICDANNRNCQPFTPESGSINVTATGQDTVEVDGLVWTRVRQ